MSRSRAEKLRSRIAPLLAEGEQVEAVISGIYGTLPGGGYPTLAWNPASVSDSYVVALTSSRLIAIRENVRRSGERVSFEVARATGNVDVRRRLWLFDWIAFVFHDRELRLLVPRRWREQVGQMVNATRHSN